MTRRDRPGAPRRGSHAVEQRVLAAFRRAAGLPAGAPLVVGLSGGSDSLATLIAVGAIAPTLGVPVSALHVDHALRPGSAAEADRARALGDALGVPVRVVRLEGGLAARHPGAGTEEAARRERYAAAAVACAGGAVFVTGHHADDQAETVLMHLARGAGLAGATGMAPLTELTVPWWTDRPGRSLRVFRPMLGFTRAELAAYRAERRPDLVPVEDASNAGDGPRRNAVRHHALPALEAAFPGAALALARFAELAREDDDWLAAEAAEAARYVIDRDGSLDRSAVTGPATIGRRLVLGWLARFAPAVQPSLDRVDAIRSAAAGDGPVHVEVGAGYVVAARGDRLRLERADPTPEGGGADTAPAR